MAERLIGDKLRPSDHTAIYVCHLAGGCLLDYHQVGGYDGLLNRAYGFSYSLTDSRKSRRAPYECSFAGRADQRNRNLSYVHPADGLWSRTWQEQSLNSHRGGTGDRASVAHYRNRLFVRHSMPRELQGHVVASQKTKCPDCWNQKTRIGILWFPPLQGKRKTAVIH